jgi:hypothetical protein
VADLFNFQCHPNVGAPPFAVFEGWEYGISGPILCQFQNEIRSLAQVSLSHRKRSDLI